MRILQVHTLYRQAGGEDVVVQAQRDALSRAGHQVWQHIATNRTGRLGAVTAVAGSMWNPVAARQIGAVVDEVRPDVAHVHNTWIASSPSVLAALRRRRVPVVMTVHNYRLACANALFLRDGAPCEKCLDRGSWAAVQHRCYRNNRAASALAAAVIAVHSELETWARLVDRFIVLNEFARERLIRAGLPARKLRLGSNFVEDPGPRERPPSRSRDVLFVGRISPEKGIAVLLEAWRRAAPAGLRLVVIGDGPDRARLEAAGQPEVKFLGQRSSKEVMNALLRARALVIPSVCYEMQPMTALEGMAAGVPLVVSKIGGLPELLQKRMAGWTSPPDDADALARTLAELTADRAIDERGAQARQSYLESFAASSAIPRLESVYNSVVVSAHR